MLAYHGRVAQGSPTRLTDLLALRDRMMADNLRYAADAERGRGRLFAFAHNSHLKRGQAVWEWGADRLAWWPAGAHLNVSMGARYAVVGVGVGTSAASRLGPPEPDTLEGLLCATPGPARLIPTRLGAGLDIPSLPVRNTGGNPAFFPLGSESLTDFDFIAVMDDAQ